MASSTETTLLRAVTPQDIFNLPLNEHHLVIDTRTHGEYTAGHIATAVSLPSPCVDCSEAEREKQLVQFIKAYIKEYVRPENPSPVILYGSNQPECVQHTQWLASKLEKLQTARKALAKVQGDEHTDIDEVFDPFEYFCHTIADRVREIWILDGAGYKEFCAEYDFLCGLVTFEDMFPLPHQVNRNVFLGSRVVPLTRECLSTLKITHMIVSSHQTLDCHELEDISVLYCDVQDSNKQDMTLCWRACMTFIEDALSSNKHEAVIKKPVVCDPNEGEEFSEGGQVFECSHVRILVILHGRSRSASVVLAHLIKTMRIGFDEAWQFVHKNCWHLIDGSLIYEDQLKEWAKSETKAVDQN